jgi:hypothetical protein
MAWKVELDPAAVRAGAKIDPAFQAPTYNGAPAIDWAKWDGKRWI